MGQPKILWPEKSSIFVRTFRCQTLTTVRPCMGNTRFAMTLNTTSTSVPMMPSCHAHTYAYTEREKRYQANAATCNACPLKSKCTTSDQGRVLKRSFDEEYLDRIRAYHATEEYQKAMRKRSVWVEPLFAEGKDWHGMRRYRLRRLWRVNCEALIRATGQNLKRLLKKRGWGRRPWPQGATNALLESPSTERILLHAS